MVKVSIVKAEDYSGVEGKIREAINLIGGIKKFVSKGDKVLLKLNLLIIKEADSGVVTHPKIVEVMIKIVQEAGGVVFVGDSPMGRTSAEEVCKAAGIKEVCDKLNVKIINLETPVVKEVKDAKLHKAFKIAKEIYDFDKIINLPKLKTHLLCGMTLGVKNMYGVIPGYEKRKYHKMFPDDEDFADMLIDLNLLVKPALVIVDGITGMEGQGPSAGKVRDFKLVLASSSNFALDAIIAEIFGMRKKIPTVYLAKKRRIKGASLREIDIVGEKIGSVRINDLKYPFIRKVISLVPRSLKKMIVPKPVPDYDKCIGCGRCSDICPVDAIKIVDKKPKFDYKKCIKCFSCHEVCPEGAIRLK